ncbi:MAG: aminotransferase class V-fold PLP-dependent enzyme [Sandaracinaceae bacterium]
MNVERGEGARAQLGDRSLFPSLEAFAYLNHAAISPPSAPVKDAVNAVIDDYASHGVSAFGRWLEQRQALRGQVGRLIHAAPEDIAFVSSTTRSVVDVAVCFPWKPGDRVLCFRGEFPTNVTPWQRAAETHGLELRMLDAASLGTDAGFDALEAELARGVRLVAVSAVQFQTGLRMPLEGIVERCQAAGTQVFVDAIQGCGVVPMDVTALGVDYVGCGSHKWLMGLEGAGFLYVKPGRAAELVPRVAGWLSHEQPLEFLFEGEGHLRYDRPIRPEATFLESGAMNAAGFAALGASVGLIEQIGVDAIFAHVQRYHDAIEPKLVERGFVSERSADSSRRSGTLSLRPPAGLDLKAVHASMNEQGVAVTMPDGRLRFAPHWPNDVAEVPRVLDALDHAMGAR